MIISLRIENTYEDGTEIITEITDIEVPDPPAHPDDFDLWADWADDYILPHTGTGKTDGDAWYDVEVTASDSADLPVGKTFDWGY